MNNPNLKHIIYLFVVLFVAPFYCSVSWARLGESEKQLNERYGAYLKKEGNLLVYRKKDYEISFLIGNENKSIYLMIKRIKEPLVMNTEEINAFLDKNSGNSEWLPAVVDVKKIDYGPDIPGEYLPTNRIGFSTFLKTKDGKRMAVVDTCSNTLVIHYMQQNDSFQKNEYKERLKDF